MKSADKYQSIFSRQIEAVVYACVFFYLTVSPPDGNTNDKKFLAAIFKSKNRDSF